ncbi:MAG: hypothetical protein KTR32_39480 [Granulosicoccus sp.]|nr:hypothetical protein [Granulosicoccus sp.]
MNKRYILSVLLLVCSLLLSWTAALAEDALDCVNDQLINTEFNNGSAWRMCWESRQRENLVLSQVQFKPANGQYFPVFSSLRLSQLHVTYDDSNVTYNDVTQFGLGAGYVRELDTNDCPFGELLGINTKPGLCVTVSDGKDLYSTAQETRRAQSLTLQSTSMVGAYAYLATWKFFADGSIEPSIGAAGALQRSSDDGHSHFGRKLEGSGDKSWLSHTHNYYWRLDFDLGVAANDDIVNEISFNIQDDGTREKHTLRLSEESARAVNREAMTAWEIADSGDTSNPVTYLIEPTNYGHRHVNRVNEPYTEFDFFVTRQNDCERFVSENAKFYPDCNENILEFTNNENIVGEDIVVWHRISFHHVPRNEDRSIMHSHWDGFVIEARNLHEATPAYAGTLSDQTQAAIERVAAETPEGDESRDYSEQVQGSKQSDTVGCSIATRHSAGTVTQTSMSIDFILLITLATGLAIYKRRIKNNASAIKKSASQRLH